MCPTLIDLDDYDSSNNNGEQRQKAKAEDDRAENLVSNLEELIDWDNADLPLRLKYSQYSVKIARYLTTLKRPVSIEEMFFREFHKFKREALTF